MSSSKFPKLPRADRHTAIKTCFAKHCEASPIDRCSRYSVGLTSRFLLGKSLDNKKKNYLSTLSSAPAHRSEHYSKFVGHLLHLLDTKVSEVGVISNEETQKGIESLILYKLQTLLSRAFISLV